MGNTEWLIAYIIENLSGKITKTQLVKLLYLADLASVKFTNTPISEIEWVYHHYGPYDKKLNERLKILESKKIIDIKPHIKGSGESYFIFQYTNKLPSPQQLEPIKKDIVDTIVKQFGSFTLDTLLGFVYRTKPMKSAKKGEVLDLRTILPKTNVATQ